VAVPGSGTSPTLYRPRPKTKALGGHPDRDRIDAAKALPDRVHRQGAGRGRIAADLPDSIKQLGDIEFERLLSAVLAEQKRRGAKSSESGATLRKRQVQAVGGDAPGLVAGEQVKPPPAVPVRPRNRRWSNLGTLLVPQ
jgi:hypothetical protein